MSARRSFAALENDDARAARLAQTRPPTLSRSRPRRCSVGVHPLLASFFVHAWRLTLVRPPPSSRKREKGCSAPLEATPQPRCSAWSSPLPLAGEGWGEGKPPRFCASVLWCRRLSKLSLNPLRRSRIEKNRLSRLNEILPRSNVGVGAARGHFLARDGRHDKCVGAGRLDEFDATGKGRDVLRSAISAFRSLTASGRMPKITTPPSRNLRRVGALGAGRADRSRRRDVRERSTPPHSSWPLSLRRS